MLRLNKREVLTSLESLREAVETAMAEPVYNDYTIKTIMMRTDLSTTERILLQFLSLQQGEVKGSFIMEKLGIKGKAFRNNTQLLLDRGLIRKGKGYSTWIINQPKKGIL
jgi:hypothetical protein